MHEFTTADLYTTKSSVKKHRVYTDFNDGIQDAFTIRNWRNLDFIFIFDDD